MDTETAKTIVRQFYPDANDPALTDILEASKGTDYRPYYVAAFFIWSSYRQLIRADEVTFEYDKLYTIKGLLAMQRGKDKNDPNIPPGHTVDDMLALLPGASSHNPSFSVAGMFDAGVESTADATVETIAGKLQKSSSKNPMNL